MNEKELLENIAKSSAMTNIWLFILSIPMLIILIILGLMILGGVLGGLN